MALLIGLNANTSTAHQTYVAPGQPLIATNAPDYAAARALEVANIGNALGVPPNLQDHAKAIVQGWPLFLAEAKAKGVQTDGDARYPLWCQYTREIGAALQERAAKATREALAASKDHIAANAAKIYRDLGVTAEQLAAAGPSSAEAQLTPAQRSMCRQLGITAEAFLAAPGERPR